MQLILDPLLLLNFLKFNDFDVEKSKSSLVENLQMRKKHPTLFTERDLFGDNFQQVFKVHQIIPLNKFTAENNKITVFRTLSGESKEHNACDVFRFFLASLDVRLVTSSENELPDGDILIYDMKNFGFKQLMKFLMDVSSMKAYLKYCQDYSPTKIVQVHFMNCSSVIPKLMAFIKPFLNKEVAENLRFHTSLESLHKTVSEEFLPNEYGGSLGKLDYLNEEWHKVLMEKR